MAGTAAARPNHRRSASGSGAAIPSTDPGFRFLYTAPGGGGGGGSDAGGPSPSSSISQDYRPTQQHANANSLRQPQQPAHNACAAAGSEGFSSERWHDAVDNVEEMSRAFQRLQRVMEGAVYLEEGRYAKERTAADLARKIRELERKVDVLGRELDEALAAAQVARRERQEAQFAQRKAEEHAADLEKQLESTSEVFKIHTKELTQRGEEIQRKQDEITALQEALNRASIAPAAAATTINNTAPFADHQPMSLFSSPSATANAMPPPMVDNDDELDELGLDSLLAMRHRSNSSFATATSNESS